MGYASIKSDTGRALLKGTTTGFLIADPLFKFMSNLLFVEAAGCDKVGNATLEFPKGQPTNCHSEAAYLGVYYAHKCLVWAGV